MGGKAKRRREKNYLAAHGGGNVRLPPPPDPSAVDVVPSKLRKIMSFADKNAFSDGAQKKNISAEKGIAQRQVSVDESGVQIDKIKKNNDETLVTKDSDDLYDGFQHKSASEKEKKKKKRKRNHVNDLRFEESDKLVGTGAKRKERRKLRNEVRKKKRKGFDEQKNLESLNHDIVKFGDIVQAPPKLSFVPKGSKNSNTQVAVASQERLRIQAVDSYRKRKGWTSRPGLGLDPTLSTPPLL